MYSLDSDIYAALEGPRFIACIITLFLFGVVTTLGAEYYRVYSRIDRTSIKLLVLVSYLSLATQNLGILIRQYGIVVDNPGSLEYLNTITTGVLISGTVAPIPVLLAKILYAERCFWVSRNRYVVGMAGILITLSTIGSVASTVVRIQGGVVVASENARYILFNRFFLWTTLLCDIFLVGTFYYFLRRLRSGFTQLDKIITQLGRVAILAASITTFAAFLAAVSEEIPGMQNAYVVFYQILPALYTLSILITLNTRNQISKGIPTALESVRAQYPMHMEKHITLMPYRSKMRPSVQYKSGVTTVGSRIGSTSQEGTRVDCRSTTTVEILDLDSLDPDSILKTLDKTIFPLLVPIDPHRYHQNFNDQQTKIDEIRVPLRTYSSPR